MLIARVFESIWTEEFVAICKTGKERNDYIKTYLGSVSCECVHSTEMVYDRIQ
jgi:hypothetical protein